MLETFDIVSEVRGLLTLILDGEVSKQGWPRGSGSFPRKATFPLRQEENISKGRWTFQFG